MLESIFTGILPLALLLALAFFVTVTVHELGHAIPALLMTREDVTIYIGSFGDPYKSFRRQFGRVEFYCKYNPLLWYKGCCVTSDYYLSLNQRIWVVAGGPIASFLVTIMSWILVSVTENLGFLRVVSGGVFVISLGVTLGILIPTKMVRYTPSGYPVYNDTYQIFRLLRMKYR